MIMWGWSWKTILRVFPASMLFWEWSSVRRLAVCAFHVDHNIRIVSAYHKRLPAYQFIEGF
jgi:hypothetical protein